MGKGKRKKGNAREMNARELERKGGRRTYSSNELDLIISVSLSLSVVVSRVIHGSGGVGLGENGLGEERVLLEGLVGFEVKGDRRKRGT